MDIFIIISFAAILLIVYSVFTGRQSRQLAYIRAYQFPQSINKKLQDKYPDLTDEDVTIVMNGLKDYFCFCNQAKKRMVAMPSQVVDLAWHEFILFTKNYKQFSRKAIGRFLHHTPTEAMRSPTHVTSAIKRAWRLACLNEKIDPSAPTRLPQLFSIDAMLKIENGFKYSLDCKNKNSVSGGDKYCAGHINCASGDAGDSGGSSVSFDCISDSSGCGGGGCGGD